MLKNYEYEVRRKELLESIYKTEVMRFRTETMMNEFAQERNRMVSELVKLDNKYKS